MNAFTDDVGRLRVTLRRLEFAYVTDVDDALFENLAAILTGVRRHLGESRFVATTVAALRRIDDAKREAYATDLPTSIHRDPAGRVLDELQRLSDRTVSTQFVATVESILGLYLRARAA